MSLKSVTRFITVVGFVMGLSVSAQAAVKTWTGATDATWSTTTNWTGGTPVNNDALAFNNSTNLTNTNTLVGLTASNVTFSAPAGAFVISGNILTMGTNTAITNSSANIQTINLSLIGQTGLTFNAASANLNIGFSINNFLIARRTRISDYYAGARDVSALTRTEIETGYGRPTFNFSIRKTFN